MQVRIRRPYPTVPFATVTSAPLASFPPALTAIREGDRHQ